MGKNRHLVLISVIVGIFFSQNIYAMEIQPVQSKNSLLIKTGNMEQIIDDIPAFIYNDSNYFMLRDVGNFMGYRVEWDDLTKQAFMVKDSEIKKFGGLSKLNNVENTTYCKQNIDIVINDIKYQDIDCLNIGGYNYFKLLELSDIMNFSCDWNAQYNTITISDKIDTGINIDKEDSRIKTFLDKDLNQVFIEDKGVKYIGGSKNYNDIEIYIRDNISGTFKASDYSITESDIYGNGIITLDFRFKVGDTDKSNFGYRIICIDGVAKIVNFIGENNPDFDLNKISDRNLSENDVKKMAINLDGFKYKVDEQIVTKFFDMKDLQYKYEVETVYIDEGGRYFATAHLF